MSKHNHKYFYEDEVWRLHKGSLKFGMVVETSELTSSEESSDDDEQVKPGDVRVAWYPSGNEEIVSERKLHLADRSLMPGDIVRRLTDKDKCQRGFCRNVHVFSSLEIVGTKQVVFVVKSEDLLPLDQFKPDVLICKENWVGIIRDVKTKLTLRFSDGSKVVIDDSLGVDLEDVFNRKEHDTEFKRYDYFPGQILFGPVRLVEAGEWRDCSSEMTNTRKNKPHKAFKMIVEDVEVGSIQVNWLCRSHFGSAEPGELVEQPSQLVTGADLDKVRMLNVFDPCTLQIGDRSFYVLRDSDLMLSKSEWKKIQMDQLYRKAAQKGAVKNVPKAEVEAAEEKAVVEDGNSSEYEDCEEKDTDSNTSDKPSIDGTRKKKKSNQPALSTRIHKKKKLKMSKSQRDASSSFLVEGCGGMKVVAETLTTRSEVDVVWQDGHVENNIPSTDLYPIQHLDEHEFFPGDFVVESKDEFHPHNYGVVQDVDYAGRFCRVKWFRTYTEGSRPEPLYLDTSEASVYDLKDHPDFKFRPGAIVIRVANWSGEDCGLGAGQVVGTDPAGKVEVWWATAQRTEGITSHCWPQDLYKVGEYDSDEGELWADEENEEDGAESDGSWSTESEHEVNEDDEAAAELHDEAAELKTKIIMNFEKVQFPLIGLEKVLKESPGPASQSLIKKVLIEYTHCRYLDKLMQTDFFHPSNFQGLVEKLKDQEKISTVERAVQSQVTRLFSVGDEKSMPTLEGNLSLAASTSPGKDSGNCSLAESPPKVEGSQVCLRLVTLLKEQLVKAHEEVVKRFGEQELHNFKEDLEDIGDMEELNEIVASELAILGFKEQLVNAHEEVVKKVGEQELRHFNDKEDLADIDDMEELKAIVASELAMLGFIPHDTPIYKEIFPDPTSPEEKLVLPTSPDDKPEVVLENTIPLAPGSFQTVESVPDSHKFKLTIFQPLNMKIFIKSVKREIALLKTSLPSGITVRGYDERMDLYSAMIEGPKNTPYEDGLFFLDFQLGPQYPSVPPTCHYVSYCSDRLNPNLYEDGKVCVSLLGTWNGKGTETWTPNSNLLQLLVSIQGLILVREPYFNEAGYERQRGTQEGAENSRNYNEMAVLKLVQSMTRLVRHPPVVFADEIKAYCEAHAPCLIERMENWLTVSLCPPESASGLPDKFCLPDFPLLPASRGFCLSLQKSLATYKAALKDTSRPNTDL